MMATPGDGLRSPTLILQGWVAVWRCEQLCVVRATGPPTYRWMALCKHPRSNCAEQDTHIPHTPLSHRWDAWRATVIISPGFSLCSQPRRSWGQLLTHVSLCSLSVCCIFRWRWVQLPLQYYCFTRVTFNIEVCCRAQTWLTPSLSASVTRCNQS